MTDLGKCNDFILHGDAILKEKGSLDLMKHTVKFSNPLHLYSTLPAEAQAVVQSVAIFVFNG